MCSIRVAIILIVLMCVNLSTSVASNMPDGKNIDSPSLTTIKDKIDEIEDYINSKPELEKRAQACIATYEKIAQAKNYISSIAELFKNNELTLPIGIKSDKKKYTICIEEIYRDVDKSGTVQYVKAICVIPLQGGKNLLAFEGIVQIEGENGIGTHGKLSLVSTNKMALGSQSSLYFCEGSSISFSCGGFDRAHANLMVGINDLGRGGHPDTIAMKTRQIVRRIKTESPRTEIYIQSVLPTNDHYGLFGGHTARWKDIPVTNELLRRVAEEEGVTYIDLFSLFADEDGKMNINYSNDGLHLTGKGYMVWCDAVKSYL